MHECKLFCRKLLDEAIWLIYDGGGTFPSRLLRSQENFSAHGSIACRLNGGGIARQLISLTDPDVWCDRVGVKFHRRIGWDCMSGLHDNFCM